MAPGDVSVTLRVPELAVLAYPPLQRSPDRPPLAMHGDTFDSHVIVTAVPTSCPILSGLSLRYGASEMMSTVALAVTVCVPEPHVIV
jgi:hypothetical protein